jgi:hypothetical protein
MIINRWASKIARFIKVEESKTCHNWNRKSHGAHVNLRPRYGTFVASKLILVKKSNQEKEIVIKIFLSCFKNRQKGEELCQDIDYTIWYARKMRLGILTFYFILFAADSKALNDSISYLNASEYNFDDSVLSRSLLDSKLFLK